MSILDEIHEVEKQYKGKKVDAVLKNNRVTLFLLVSKSSKPISKTCMKFTVGKFRDVPEECCDMMYYINNKGLLYTRLGREIVEECYPAKCRISDPEELRDQVEESERLVRNATICGF